MTMTKPIDNYMTPTEAAHRWGIAASSLKDRLNGRSAASQELTRQLISDGLVKSFLAPGGQRREWIVSVAAMVRMYGEEPKINL